MHYAWDVCIVPEIRKYCAKRGSSIFEDVIVHFPRDLGTWSGNLSVVTGLLVTHFAILCIKVFESEYSTWISGLV